MHVLIILDDKIGHNIQARGIAKALSYPYKEFYIDRSHKYFGMWHYKYVAKKLIADLEEFVNSTVVPDIVIGAGSTTAPLLVILKQKYNCFVCNIMWPGYILASQMSLNVINQHDNFIYSKLLRSNCLKIMQAPHLLFNEEIAKYGSIIRNQIDNKYNKSKKIITVILGGDNYKFSISLSELEIMASKVMNMAKLLNARIFITTSPRTSKEQIDCFKNNIEPSYIENYFIYDKDNKNINPYYDYICVADILIITSDSISMISECCSGPGSLYIYELKNFVGKYKKFIKTLVKYNFARYLSGSYNNYIFHANKTFVARHIARAIEQKILNRTIY